MVIEVTILRSPPPGEQSGRLVVKRNPRMQRLRENITAFLQEDSGQDLMEYALIVMFIALIAIASLKTFGDTVENYWNNLNTGLSGLQ
jgi:Flp pilus assembly pilin Flp